MLGSPYYLIGSVVALRERHGVSYLTVFPPDVETFAPVVARLAGT